MELFLRIRPLLYALFAINLAFSIALSNIYMGLIIAYELARAVLLKQPIAFRRSPIDLPVVCALVWFAISAAAGVDPMVSARAVKAELLVIIFYLSYLFLEPRQVRLVVTVFVGASIFVGLIGIAQYFLKIDLGHDGVFRHTYDCCRDLPESVLKYLSRKAGRLKGTRSHPLTFAECLFFGFVLNAALVMLARSVRMKLYWSAGLLAQGMALLFSYSRGVWIATALALGFFAYTGFGRSRRLLLIVLAVLAAVFLVHPGMRGRIMSADASSSASNSIRLNLWQSGLAISRDFPVFGVGPRNVRTVYPRYQRPSIPDKRIWSELHNTYLQLLAERGIVGLGLFLWLLASIFRCLRRAARTAPRGSFEQVFGRAMLAAFAGFLVYSVTENALFDSEVAMIFYFLIGCSFALSCPRQPEEERSDHGQQSSA